MGDKTRKGSGKGGGLGPEDFQLWKEFTRDIEPLEGVVVYEPEKDAPSRKPRQESGAVKSPPLPRTASSSSEQPPQLDARTELRLRRGQMPVQGTLDLHGYNQEQAHELLKSFLIAAHASGKRCVLVITGKGRRGVEDSVGVLRQKLPMWLSMPPLRDIVLKRFDAAPRHGGTGACYIYLKRTRDYA